MKERTTRILRSITGALVLLVAAHVPLLAQGDVLGDWYGVLDTPVGQLTLIVTIQGGDDGALQAELEVPEQAPGRMIPITRIEAADGRLAFTIQAIAASYEGEWIETDQQWSGVFTQNGEMPLTFERGAPPGRPVFEGLDGVWEGIVTRNGVDLRLVLRVNTGDQGTIATFDAPDMPVFDLPVIALSRDSETVGFKVPGASAGFDGVLSDDGSRLTGLWTFPGQPDTEVTFIRGGTGSATQTRHRPQAPKAPFDYRVEEVSFENPLAAGVQLAGTLTLPHGRGPFPAAILISGSGPQDRDETVFGHKPFAVLADHLTRNGIAVLRYDDRGFGASTGSHGVATSADFATDANAAARYLKARTEIDRDAIGFIGHSEGGMIAPIAAVDNDEMDFLVLLAAPGTNTGQLTRTQNRLMARSRGVSEDYLDRTASVTDEIIAAVAVAADKEDAQGKVRALLTPEALEKLDVPESRKDVVVQQYTTNWLRYFLRYDPPTFLRRIDVPVLALNGSLDLQVPAAENLAGIAASLAHNRDHTIRELEGLNHMFQTAETGALGEYADIAETFAPAALEIVAHWINSRFGSRGTVRSQS